MRHRSSNAKAAALSATAEAERGAHGALARDEARRWARAGVLAALALVLSYAETFVPLPLPVPGAKLGLANIPVLVALVATDARCAFAVAIVKTLAAGLLFGSPIMIPYSAAGTLLSFVAMFALVRVPGLHLVMVSVCGSVCHIVGQLAVASLILGTPLVWYAFPLLMAVACATGVLTGKVAAFLLESLEASGERAAAAGMAGAAGAGGKSGESCGNGALGDYAGESGESGASGERAGEGCGSEGGKLRVGAAPATEPAATTVLEVCVSAPARPTRARRACRVDVRVLLLALLAYLVVALCVRSALALGACALLALAAALAAKMRPRDALKALAPLSSLLVVTAVAQIACAQQGAAIAYVGPVAITQEAIVAVAFMAVRLLCIMAASAAFARVVSADELACALASAFGTIERVGVRTRGVALALDLALRFVPVLMEEFSALKAEREQADPALADAGLLAKLRAYRTMFALLAARAFAYADREADRIAA